MDRPVMQQTPEKVLTDFLDYLDNPDRSTIDNVFNRLLMATDEVLLAVLTGERKKTVKRLIDADLVGLTVDDYTREGTPPAVKKVVDGIIERINVIDAANKSSNAVALDTAMAELTDYVCLYPKEVDAILIDGLSFGVYLHSIAGTDECNNILASTVRPRLMAVSAGRTVALLVEDRLTKLKILR